MTTWDRNRFKNVFLAGGLGVAFSLTGAAYAQDAGGEAPIGLFDEKGENLEGQEVGIDELGQIDITVKDLEIAKVLQLLSIQSQRNIVTSRNVSGKVSADLYGVSFHEALEAILTPNGYGYEEQGNFIYVYTAQELQERLDEQRKTVTKLVRLNYISAADAAEFISSLLSSTGSVTATGEPDTGFLPSDTDGGENSFAHSDTLLIKDYEENVEEVLATIKELDIRPKQVLIEATILQAELSENNAFGIDFAVFANFDGLTDFVNPLGAVGELISGDNLSGGGGTAVTSQVGSVGANSGGIQIGVTGSDASIFLEALDQVTDTTIVSKPNILVLNRQKADILVGSRLGFLSTTVTDTSETQTIEFLDVGTQLSVRPFVTNEGTVRLELRPAVSSGEVNDIAGFVVPNEFTQELITNVIIESGQTVVLGGLFTENTSVERDQVPVLGDLPLVGSAFRGHSDSTARTEIIFMVKTTIMDHANLALLGEKGEKRVRDARVAARDGVLPYSNDKQVSAHLLDARRHYEAGKTGKALWSVNLALHLQPTSEEGIALKELIVGEPAEYFDQTFVGEIGNELIDQQLESAPAVEESSSDETALIEESLGSKAPARPESTFVLPAAGFGQSPDNSAANQDQAAGVIVVDSVDELEVPADESTADSSTQQETETDVALDQILFFDDAQAQVNTDNDN